jgi:regulator of sigma E protease
VTLASWFIAFAGFAMLIVLHELGHFVAAKAVGMRVERFALFFPPLILKKTVGETEYGIGSIPLGGYVRISGMSPAEDLPDDVRDRAYHAQPVWKRVVVIAAGPLVNLVLAFILMAAFLWLAGPRLGITNEVAAVQGNLPAIGSLHPGDRITALNGKPGTPAEISEGIQAYHCRTEAPTTECPATETATITVQKESGETSDITLRPSYDPVVKRMRLGFEWAAGGPRQPVPFGRAVQTSLNAIWFVTERTVQLPLLFFNTFERESISGVVGTYDRVRQTVEREPVDTLWILGVISLSLAVINLFPFLPLDGGHIFWAVVELVRRRPVHYRTMEKAGAIGLLVMIPVFLIPLTNDLGAIFALPAPQ